MTDTVRYCKYLNKLTNKTSVLLQVLVGELHRTEGWVSQHVSDTCGYHYRQFLLSTLCRQREALSEQLSLQYTDLLEKEQGYIVDLIATFPGHEAMWYHRY